MPSPLASYYAAYNSQYKSFAAGHSSSESDEDYDGDTVSTGSAHSFDLSMGGVDSTGGKEPTTVRAERSHTWEDEDSLTSKPTTSISETRRSSQDSLQTQFIDFDCYSPTSSIQEPPSQKYSIPLSTKEPKKLIKRTSSSNIQSSHSKSTLTRQDSHPTRSYDSQRMTHTHRTNRNDSHRTTHSDTHGSINNDSRRTTHGDSHRMTRRGDSNRTINNDSHRTSHSDSHRTNNNDHHPSTNQDSHRMTHQDYNQTNHNDYHSTSYDSTSYDSQRYAHPSPPKSGSTSSSPLNSHNIPSKGRQSPILHVSLSESSLSFPSTSIRNEDIKSPSHFTEDEDTMSDSSTPVPYLENGEISQTSGSSSNNHSPMSSSPLSSPLQTSNIPSEKPTHSQLLSKNPQKEFPKNAKGKDSSIQHSLVQQKYLEAMVTSYAAFLHHLKPTVETKNGFLDVPGGGAISPKHEPLHQEQFDDTNDQEEEDDDCSSPGSPYNVYQQFSYYKTPSTSADVKKKTSHESAEFDYENTTTKPDQPVAPQQSQTRKSKLKRMDTIQEIIRWQPLGLIGKGAFGEVYKAINHKTGQLMAVKKLPLDVDSDDMLEVHQEEIQFLKQFQHKHIVQYIGSQIENGYLCIFLEYASEGSLRRFMRNFTNMQERIVMAQIYIRQILEGLKYLHSQLILHRDIKPDNILIDKSGVIKLADFGCAKILDPVKKNSRLTMRGTPEYASPEWITREVRIEHSVLCKIDIWSLGVTVYELTCGTHLWHNMDRLQAIYKIGSLKSTPEISEEMIPVPSLRDFIRNCLTLSPEDRPTAEEMLKHEFLSEDLNEYFAKYPLSSPVRKDKSPDTSEESTSRDSSYRHDNDYSSSELNTSEFLTSYATSTLDSQSSYFSTLRTSYDDSAHGSKLEIDSSAIVDKQSQLFASLIQSMHSSRSTSRKKKKVVQDGDKTLVL